MRFICCILLFVVAAMAVNDKPYYNLDDAPALFEKFIIDYNRSYKDEADKAMHYEAFLKSLQEINEANAKQSSATFDINKFTDYTSEESKHLFGYKTVLKSLKIYQRLHYKVDGEANGALLKSTSITELRTCTDPSGSTRTVEVQSDASV
ncbi:unnamed protein product [Euphydryas editha]|uniref:Cathepsin propeptide inhibitor domain-containing protein n=1 Tax=Euphydryas editha TaxID=104508 RepID=A0AAU9V7X0_EUPED|nr:unnamed protein product [Euphydryas editha]